MRRKLRAPLKKMPQRLMHMHIGAQREGGGGVGVLCMSAVPDKVSIMRRPTASTCHTNQIKQKSQVEVAASWQPATATATACCINLPSGGKYLTEFHKTEHETTPLPLPLPLTYSYSLTLFSTRTCRTNVHNYVHLASCRAATATK